MSWQMIGEAIEALRGSASEEVISAFILGRHPGVPQAAHDRFLRHYLAKHVAEGLFVCTAHGRYSRAASNAAQVTVAKHSQRHDRQPSVWDSTLYSHALALGHTLKLKWI
jgi:hypothetical protein